MIRFDIKLYAANTFCIRSYLLKSLYPFHITFVKIDLSAIIALHQPYTPRAPDNLRILSLRDFYSANQPCTLVSTRGLHLSQLFPRKNQKKDRATSLTEGVCIP